MGALETADMLAFLAELEKVVTETFDKHYESSDTLQYYAPFGFLVTTVNGVSASFLEEGIELNPNLKVVKKDD